MRWYISFYRSFKSIHRDATEMSSIYLPRTGIQRAFLIMEFRLQRSIKSFIY